MKDAIIEQIEEVLDQLRPSLARHYGDIELVGVEDDVVQVKFKGMCDGCPLSQMTLKMGIEAAIKDALPQIKEVVSVN